MTTPIRLEAAAGARGGSWYVLLEGLAQLVRQAHPEIEIQVVEGGGVSNLTVNHLHFVVTEETPLSSLSEWLTQKYPLRIPVDSTSTVDRLVFQIALGHYGVTEPDLETWGGGAIPAMDYRRQLALYRDQKVDALWQFMGIPSPSIQEAHELRPIKVLPLAPELLDELVGCGWQPSEIPAGAYGVVSRPIPTVAMSTSLGFHSQVPDDVVFAITEAICQHYRQVLQIHPAAAAFDPVQAHLNPGGPLHGGAHRYFESVGLKA